LTDTSKLGIWPKVEEGPVLKPEEHASELIPQRVAGKRAIQLKSSLSLHEKTSRSFCGEQFKYQAYFEDLKTGPDSSPP
jgi:hypothetical protein